MKYWNRERRRKGKISKNREKERNNWKREEKDKKRESGDWTEIFKRVREEKENIERERRDVNHVKI